MTDTIYMSNNNDFINYSEIEELTDAAEAAALRGFFDSVEEPDIDFMFEHDSAMESVGWGTDESYGYYGGDEW